MHQALKKYGRVGFIKPLGPKPTTFHRWTVDKDAALVAQVFKLEKDLRWMSPVVVHADTTRKMVDGAHLPAAQELYPGGGSGGCGWSSAW